MVEWYSLTPELGRGPERRMVSDFASRSGADEHDCLEVLGRHAGQNQAWLGPETEARVVAGFTEHDATNCSGCAQVLESAPNERAANAGPLTFRKNRHGAETVPLFAGKEEEPERAFADNCRGHELIAG